MNRDNMGNGQLPGKVINQNDYELYKRIVNLFPDAVFLSCDNKFVYANKKALKLIKAEDIRNLQSLNTIDIVHPRYRNEVIERRTSDICEEFSLDAVEIQLFCMDKSVIDVEMESNVFAFEDKLFTLTIIKEIGKRKELQRAYRDRDVLINAIFDSTIDGILVVDDKGKIININNRFSEMWNISEEIFQELDEITVLKLILGSLKEPDRCKSIITKVNSVVNEYFDNVRFRDGRVFNFYSCPLIIEGEITGRIWSFRDITKQAEAEEKLNRSNNDLSEALEKLKEVQSQMIQKEKLAGIGQLAAGVAHEINNPLAYTISNMDILRKRMDIYNIIIKKYRELAGNIENFSYQDIIFNFKLIKEIENEKNFSYIFDDMDDLIGDSIEGLQKAGHIIASLRDFSGKYEADKAEKYNINEGIENTLTLMKSEISIYAKVEMDLGSVPIIKANSGQINQVILNILKNSLRAIKIKYGNCSGVIKIKTFVQEKQIVCEIEDNGTGIKNENINKVFLPFYTTKDVGEGCGLGLSTSYDIITNKHKGEITAQSKLYEWTRFTIKLPI